MRFNPRDPYFDQSNLYSAKDPGFDQSGLGHNSNDNGFNSDSVDMPGVANDALKSYGDWTKSSILGIGNSIQSSLRGMFGEAPLARDPKGGSQSAVVETKVPIEESGRSSPDVNSIFAHGDYGSSPMRPRDLTAATMTAANEPAPDQGAAKIRAIKMPNGRIQFTNVGTESTPEGDKPKQGTWTDYGQAASKFRNEQYREPDSPTDSALVMASHRARSNNPGSIEAGSVSFMPGTDEQKRGLELEKAAGLAAMAKAGAETAEAERRTREAPMTPEERTTAESPQIAINRDAERRSFELQQANWRSSADRKRAVQTPGDPRFIADPNMQAVEIKKIEDARIAMDQQISDQHFASLHINPPAPVEYRR